MPADFLDLLHADPNLEQMAREELAKLLYLRDKRSLPDDLKRLFDRVAVVRLGIEQTPEAAQAMGFATGEVAGVNLGLATDSLHYVRRSLSMLRDREVAVDWAPKGDPFDGDVLPLFDGLLLDLSAFNGVETDREGGYLRAETAATWRDAFLAAEGAGRVFPLLPILPGNPYMGDVVGGTVVLTSYRGGLTAFLRNVDFLGPDTTYGQSGFDQVPNAATGYDFNALLSTMGRNLAVPISVTFRLLPGGALRGLRYALPTEAALVEALGELDASRLRPLRVAFGDTTAAEVGLGDGPFPLEVDLLGTEDTVTAQVAALDDLLGVQASGEAGDEVEEGEEPPEAGGPPRRERDDLDHLLTEPPRGKYPQYLTEIRAPLADAAGLWEELVRWSASRGDRVGVAGCLEESGTVRFLPFIRIDVQRQSTMGEPFDVPMNRGDRFDRVWELVRIARKHPCRLRATQLVHLLNPDPELQKRFRLARRIKERVDLPGVINPSGLFWMPSVR